MLVSKTPVALATSAIALLGAPSAEAFSTKTKHAAAKYAKTKVGNPYGWGAVGPVAFDCSGLTYAAYRKRIPRTSGAQLASSRPTNKRRIGDLLFRGSGHVGIYVGKGKAVHATKPGQPVKYISSSYFTTRRSA